MQHSGASGRRPVAARAMAAGSAAASAGGCARGQRGLGLHNSCWAAAAPPHPPRGLIPGAQLGLWLEPAPPWQGLCSPSSEKLLGGLCDCAAVEILQVSPKPQYFCSASALCISQFSCSESPCNYRMLKDPSPNISAISEEFLLKQPWSKELQ